jgi:3-oxoacyl-[acyl-carrier-protein] synthase II
MTSTVRRRVVVTGLGAVTSLGNDVESTWAAMVAGRSGVGPISLFDASAFPVRIAAEVRDFDAGERFGRRRARHLDRFVQFALAATREALEASKLDVAADPWRVGIVYGTGIGGLHTLEKGIAVLDSRGPEWVNPYTCPMMIPNMAAGQIAMEWGIQGYSSCTVTACAASTQSIGEAADLIRLGRADAVVAGGTEAPVNRTGVAGFAAMKALSASRNDEPEKASRPFDAGRDGFVVGEGAATVILEERESALRRGAPILAELIGYGATSDAHHMTAPHPEGEGALRAMQAACDDAGIHPGEVGYINAHGTSTPPNDRTEALALHRLYGEAPPPVSSTKSMTGHTLGAAGAIESVACVQALLTGVLPPTINHEVPDPDCDLDVVPNEARPAAVDVAMTNSFGFGGHNATLLFRTHR